MESETPEGSLASARPTDDEERETRDEAQTALRHGQAPTDESVGYAGQQADTEPTEGRGTAE